MPTHDTNFSDHFDGVYECTAQKNMKLSVGVRRRKTSRKRKSLIPIGKQLGGYKKVCNQWHLRGFKKRSREVKESESVKIHNKLQDRAKPFGSKTGGLSEEEVGERDFLDNVSTVEKVKTFHDDDLPSVEELEKNMAKTWAVYEAEFREPKYVSETEKHKKFLEKWGSNILCLSKEDLEFSGNMPYYIDPNSLLDNDSHFFGDMYADPHGMPGYFKTYAAKKSKGAYGRPYYDELLDKVYGHEAHKSWLEREYCKLYGTMDYYSESESDCIQKTPRWRRQSMLCDAGALGSDQNYW